MLRNVLYASLCILVPLAWGLVVARVFDWFEARRRKRYDPAQRPRDYRTEIDYYI